MPPRSTSERILDAAEALFAQQGISGTSLRKLTRRAGVNLAAVHYHFGSKQGLLDAVVERRAQPINEARTAALDRLLEASEPDAPSPEAILTAFFQPVFEALDQLESDSQRHNLGRLMARIEAQPPEQLERIYRRHFGESSARCIEALARALPDLPPEQVADRFRFATGVLTLLFSGNMDLDTIPGHPAGRTGGFEQRARHAIAFMAAGLRAPRLDGAAEHGDDDEAGDADTHLRHTVRAAAPTAAAVRKEVTLR